MAVVSITRFQTVPGDPSHIWAFFANPLNLSLITPPYMRFRTLTDLTLFPHRIYPGQLIEYRLRPLPLYSVRWVTEIMLVDEGSCFIDEQRSGPYRLWHHEHYFRPVAGGVEMTDIVNYEVPFGWIGRLANALFVRRQVEGIFDYRYREIEKLFPAGR
jgi:ligand-binding SRPBCC domain-containing protein